MRATEPIFHHYRLFFGFLEIMLRHALTTEDYFYEGNLRIKFSQGTEYPRGRAKGICY